MSKFCNFTKLLAKLKKNIFIFCNHKTKVSLKNKDVKFLMKLSVDEKHKIYKYCEDVSEKIINNLTSVLTTFNEIIIQEFGN